MQSNVYITDLQICVVTFTVLLKFVVPTGYKVKIVRSILILINTFLIYGTKPHLTESAGSHKHKDFPRSIFYKIV